MKFILMLIANLPNFFIILQDFFYIEGKGGPLFNRYNNQLTAYRVKLNYSYKNKRTVVSKKKSNQNAEEVSSQEPTNQITTTTSEEEEIISEVNIYTQPYDIFIEKWKKVYHIRSYDCQTMDYNALVNKWPVLTDVIHAHHLVCILIYFFVNSSKK